MVKAKKFQYTSTLGDFEDLRTGNNVAAEVAFLLKAYALEAYGNRLDDIKKSKIVTEFEHGKSYIGTPALPKSANSFETLDDFMGGGRAKTKTGVAKLFNLTNQQIMYFLTAFTCAYVHELYLARSSKNFKEAISSLKSNKKIQPSLVVTIAGLSVNTDTIDNDHSGPKKLDEMFSDYISNDKIRNGAVKAYVNFLKYMGIQISTMLTVNRHPMNFKTMTELVLTSLSPFGYQMRPAVLESINAFTDAEMKRIIENRATKGKDGKKLKESEKVGQSLVRGSLSKNIKPKAKNAKKNAKNAKNNKNKKNNKKNKKGDDSSDESSESESSESSDSGSEESS